MPCPCFHFLLLMYSSILFKWQRWEESGEQKGSLSLSPPQCCSSSVSHHESTHLVIHLGPCTLGCTGCEPGCLLGWNLRSGRFCSSCSDTDERCDLIFLVNPWGFQQIFCLHACPGCHPPHPPLIGDEVTQVATHTGQQHPQKEGWRHTVKSKLGPSHAIHADSAAKKAKLLVLKWSISIYSWGPGTISARQASVSTWVLLRHSQLHFREIREDYKISFFFLK